MKFFLGKIFLSDEEFFFFFFEHYNAPLPPKTGTNDITLQYKLRHFQTSEKPKLAINKLMYL